MRRQRSLVPPGSCSRTRSGCGSRVRSGVVDDQIQVGPNQLSRNEALAVGPNYRHGLTGMAVGGGAVWTVDMARSRVIRVDSRNDRVLARIPISPLPFAIVANRTGAWVATSGGSRN